LTQSIQPFVEVFIAVAFLHCRFSDFLRNSFSVSRINFLARLRSTLPFCERSLQRNLVACLNSLPNTVH